MAGAKKSNTKANKDFAAAFTGLKKILKRHAGGLSVKADKPDSYYLETRSASFRGKPVFFGCAQIKKNYVSFHLMPVYAGPALLKGMSPELKRRMQGKSCFNFTAPDPKLFAELSRLTAAGFQQYRAMKFL
jgi:hypothetical protein